MSEATFIDYGYVEKWMKENTECELISGEYKNAYSDLIFKCSCGNIFTSTFAQFKYKKTKRTCYECKKIPLNVDYFKEINTVEKAFWLGFICADGAISKTRNKQAVFSITQKEPVLIYELKKDIGYGGKIEKVEHAKGRYSDEPFYRMNISRYEFANNLMISGKARYKKDQDRVPESVPSEFVMDFIRGYFEGDGSIFYNKEQKGYVSQISSHKKILLDIQEKLGGFGCIIKDKSISSLRYTRNQTDIVIKNIYYEGHKYGIKLNNTNIGGDVRGKK